MDKWALESCRKSNSEFTSSLLGAVSHQLRWCELTLMRPQWPAPTHTGMLVIPPGPAHSRLPLGVVFSEVAFSFWRPLFLSHWTLTCNQSLTKRLRFPRRGTFSKWAEAKADNLRSLITRAEWVVAMTPQPGGCCPGLLPLLATPLSVPSLAVWPLGSFLQ